MKVLKGNLKGRNLISPQHIRPVAVRIKKACFDILREEIEGKKILDLFSGSGSLGIEALSCGAKEAVFVDIKRDCVEKIKQNLAFFKLTAKSEVHLKDAFRAIEDFYKNGETFDLIFLDPPYYKGMLIKALQALRDYDILTPLGYLVAFCYAKDEFVNNDGRFFLIVHKNYGQTLVLIYKKQEIPKD